MAMADEHFSCRACGHSVENPDRNRFTLSISRPAVCPACHAPHVYEFGVQLDQGWLKRQISELASLKRAGHAEVQGDIEASRCGRQTLRLRSGPDQRGGHRDDDGAFGTQA
jgi:hypothetical protein